MKLLLCLALVLGITGCGLPQSGPVRPIAGERIPAALSSNSPATQPQARPATGSGRTQLHWLAANRQVVPVNVELLTMGASARLTEALELLAAGPTQQQRSLGFSTALSPGVVITVFSINNRNAILELDATEAALTPAQLPLAIGQIVLTVTSNSEIDNVTFMQAGQPIGVPLIGGALTTQPLGRSSYSGLLLAPTLG